LIAGKGCFVVSGLEEAVPGNFVDIYIHKQFGDSIVSRVDSGHALFFKIFPLRDRSKFFFYLIVLRPDFIPFLQIM
jgi:hypothetical protein